MDTKQITQQKRQQVINADFYHTVNKALNNQGDTYPLPRDLLYMSLRANSRFVNTKLQQGWIIDGKREGEWVWSNVCTERGFYHNGKRDGEWIWTDITNGNIIRRGSYVKGKRDGTWKEYYKGEILFLDTYKKGVRHGPCTYKYKSGDVVSSGFYVNGKKDGKWMFWHGFENSYLIQEYKNGVKV